MKHVLHILAVSVLLGFSAVPPCGGVETATNSTEVLPPPPSPPADPYTVDDIGNTNTVSTYPFLLCYGVRDDGTYIFEPPEDWQLEPPAVPKVTTIRLKFYHVLDTNQVMTVDFTTPYMHAFAGWEVIAE